MTIAPFALCCALIVRCTAALWASEADFAGAQRKDSGRTQLFESLKDEYPHLSISNVGVSSRTRLMASLRRNLVAYYEDLPNAIRLATKTIIAAQKREMNQ